MATEHHEGRLDIAVSVNQPAQETGFTRLGRLAYVAYHESTGGVPVLWEDLDPAHQASWMMAATAVVTEIVG